MKIKFQDATKLLLVILLSGLGSLTHAQTLISGAVSTDMTLGAGSSPYALSGDVTVQSGATLTIDPGVEIIFDGAARDLIIAGGATLVCEGTASQRINIHGSAGNGGGSIYIQSGATASIEYTDLDSLGFSSLAANDCAIRVDDDAVFTMEHTVISNTQASLIADADALSNVGGTNTLSAVVEIQSSSLDASALWPKMDVSGVTYIPESDTEVNSGVVLTIDPGVTILFTSTGRDIVVQSGGFFVCEGTASDRITLGVADTTFGGGSLYIRNGGSASVKQADMSYWGKTSLSAYDCGIRADEGATFLLANTSISMTQASIAADADALSLASENNQLGEKINIFAASLDNSATWPKIDPVLTRYDLRGDITIPTGATLTINPGVTVTFNSTGFDLIVADGGTLSAEGTVAEPINFISENTTFGGGSIYVQNNAEAHLDNCVVDYLGFSTLSAQDCGIRVDEGLLDMDNTMISNSQWAIRADADALSSLGDNNDLNGEIRILTGTLNTTTTWPKADPNGVTYSLNGDQTVAAGTTLTIEPGVSIDHPGTGQDIFVDGNLVAIGEWEDRIVFFSSEGTFGGGSVYFRSGSEGTMEYFELRDLGKSTLSSRDAGVAIDNANVDLFTGFISGSQAGIRIDNGTDAITINGIEFTGNKRGIDINSATSLPRLRYSTFMGNSPYAVDNGTALTLDACYNYWGDASGPHSASNPISMGDTINGMIDAPSICVLSESALTDCAAPIELSNTVTSPDVITFNWTRVPNALGYRINAARTPDEVGFQSVINTKSVAGVVTGDTVVWSVKAGCFFSPGVLDISPKSTEVSYVVGPLRTAAPAEIVKLFPNPAVDVLTVSLPSTLQSKGATVQVIDLQGRVVLQERFGAGSAHQLDIQKLESGNYFLQLHANGESFSTGFAVQ